MIEKNDKNLIHDVSNLEIAIKLINSGFVIARINPKTKKEQVKITEAGILALNLLQKLIKGGNI